MRHRHSGRYRSKTPRGRIVYKHRPVHSQSLMRKNKNKTYKQLRRKFRIHPLADDDKDKIRNYKDCRPWNNKRQDETMADQERHLDSIYRLQQDIRGLRDELMDVTQEFDEVAAAYWGEQQKGIENNQYAGEYNRLFDKKLELENAIFDKNSAIREEKEWLE